MDLPVKRILRNLRARGRDASVRSVTLRRAVTGRPIGKTHALIAMVVIAAFCLALALATLGSPWSWAAAVAVAAGVGAAALVMQAREIHAMRAQLARLAGAIGETKQRVSSEQQAATAELTDEVNRLRDRLRAAERVAGQAWVRLQRYDLIQRPGGFEIELLCDVCNAWRPSGVVSTWEHFKRDEPFVTAEGRFILSCGHEVRADNYNARPGAKVAPSVRKLGAPAERPARETVEPRDAPVALRK
jgi:hypothetical protein